MTIWVDAHLSPGIAKWIRDNFPVDAIALRDLNLRDAEDPDIFRAAKDADAVVMTKDSDYGNTSNARLARSCPKPCRTLLRFWKGEKSSWRSAIIDEAVL